jgi:hypothetical protein
MLKSANGRWLTGLATLLCLASTADAEEPVALQTGARVRALVTRPSQAGTQHKKLTGTLLELSESALTLETGRGRSPVVLPRSAIESLEVSVHRSKRGKGALMGLAVGVLAGVALGAAANAQDDFFSEGETMGIFVALMAPVGTLVGLAVAPGEKWQAVPPQHNVLAPGGTAMVPRRGVWLTLRFQACSGWLSDPRPYPGKGLQADGWP